MAHKGVSTRLGIAVGILIVGISLSGCGAVSAFVHSERKEVAAAGKPKVGECWTSTYENAHKYADWGDAPPVDCTKPHQLDTFAVPTLEYVHTGALYDSKGLLTPSVSDDAFQTCYNAMATDLSPNADEDELLSLVVFVPEEPQWDSGARWLRCDLSVIAYGSAVVSPRLSDLPSTLAALKSAVRTSPKEFKFCTNDPGVVDSSPKDATAVYADCRSNPKWQLKDYDEAIYDDEAVVPYKKAVTAVYDSQCKAKYTDKTHVTYPYYPSQADWKANEGEVECWVGVK